MWMEVCRSDRRRSEPFSRRAVGLPLTKPSPLDSYINDQDCVRWPLTITTFYHANSPAQSDWVMLIACGIRSGRRTG